MPESAVEKFGENVPMKRPGQPAELATTFVMLADPLSSYVSGATIAVTGGRPDPIAGGLRQARRVVRWSWRILDDSDTERLGGLEVHPRARGERRAPEASRA
jgi:hypothetical protein